MLLGVLWAFPLPAGPDLCGFHRLTHLQCPLCGLTRSLFALVKGHWAEAICLHALSPLTLAMVFAGLWDLPMRNRLWALGVVAFAIYGIGRLFA